MKKNMLIIGLLSIFTSTQAKIKLPSVYADNMVLQQKSKIPIDGEATPAASVTLRTSWNGKTYETKADGQGRWKLTIQTPDFGGPYEMIVSDGEELTLKNLLIGDVWFCSGQSNMEMPLAGWGKILNYEEEIAKADYSNIRLLQVSHTTGQVPSSNAVLWQDAWKVCAPQNIPEFSSTAYFFAREVYKKTGVPIGLIHSSWGGTYVEAWMSENTLTKFSALKEAYEKMRATPVDSFDTKNGNQPTVLYNAMVAPFIHFPIKGAIWYQGESNADRAVAYRELFPTMIKDWREKWGIGNFPFYFVQLANFMKKEEAPAASNWGMLREAQGYALKLPNTGMAVIADIGDADDIHPKNKQEVGRRLALQALKQTYKQDLVSSGPVLKSYKVKGNEALLSFDVPVAQLVLKEENHVFAIAGEDHQFHWATVTKNGSQLVLSSPEVAKPVAVRYAWANNPDLGIFNAEGLPASPFRTDNWEE